MTRHTQGACAIVLMLKLSLYFRLHVKSPDEKSQLNIYKENGKR